MEASPEYLARVPDIKDPKHRVHAAMTIALDDGVGRVMAALRAAGLEENTLVFFLSDNGGTSKGASSNRPLRGEKHTYWEGGIRVPWMLQWKCQVPAGKVIDAPVITLDMSATVLAVAGADLTATKLDGVNLLPFLRGESTTTPHETLFWRWGDHMAIRQGDWKLVKTADPKNTGRPSLQLYNLADDLGEKNNLSAANPGKLAELQAAWSAWNAEQAAPRWSDGDK
jgi:arylsulfatase A-like enzyme